METTTLESYPTREGLLFLRWELGNIVHWDYIGNRFLSCPTIHPQPMRAYSYWPENVLKQSAAGRAMNKGIHSGIWRFEG